MKKQLLTSVWIIICLSACDGVYNYQPNVDNNLIGTFFESVETEPDLLTIDIEVLDTVYSDEETVVIVPPCIFALPDGTNLCDIDSENDTCAVTVNLIEVYDKRDMILNNLTTTSEGVLLETGGMAKLSAYCGDTPLHLIEGEYFIVCFVKDRTPTDDEKMVVYEEEKPEEMSINWKYEGELMVNDEKYYGVRYNETNRWVGCFYPHEYTEEGDIQVSNTQELFTTNNSRVFLAFDNLHAVAGTSYELASFWGRSLPKDEPLTAIAIHTDGQALLSGRGKGSIGQEEELAITMNPYTIENLYAELKDLD